MKWIAGLTALALSQPLRAQVPPATNFEVLGGLSAVAGVVPIRVDGIARVSTFAGFDVNAGFQFPHVSLALCLDYWELTRGSDYGGAGIDVAVLSEFRQSRGSLTTIRFGVGGGDGSMDRGRSGTDVSTERGVLVFGGMGREILVSSNRFLVTADLRFPNTNDGLTTRRRPALQFGVGYRLRSQQEIRPIHGPRL